MPSILKVVSVLKGAGITLRGEFGLESGTAGHIGRSPTTRDIRSLFSFFWVHPSVDHIVFLLPRLPSKFIRDATKKFIDFAKGAQGSSRMPNRLLDR